MQANIIFRGGTQTIVDADKVHFTTTGDGKIKKLEWSNSPDAHSVLRYVNPEEIAAIVMIRSWEEAA